MLILYFLNTLVIINSILIAKNLYSTHGVSDKILISFTMYLAQIIFFVLLLGIPGALTVANISILTVISFLVVIFMFKHRRSSSFFPHANFVKESVLWISQHKLLAISISIFLGFSLVKAFQNLINPPFLWGSLIYHFRFPAEWVKNGNLVNPSMVFGNPAIRYFTMNSELLFFWFMLPLKSVFIADIVSYPFYIIGAVACFGIMRRLGISEEIALFSGILFSLTPQYFKHILFNGNDIIVASLFLIALNFVLALKECFSFKTIVIAGVAIGLLWGTKLTAMIWAPLLVPLAIYFMIKNYKKIKFAKLLLLGLIFAMLIFMFGGFTYVRNFIETGNPFYPVNYGLAGLTLKGPIEFSDISDNTGLLNIDLEEMLFHQSFGLHFIILAFPALFLSLPIMLIKTRFRLSFDIIYLLALPMIMITAFYAKCPHHTPSYLYHVIAMGTMIGIYALYKFPLSPRVIRWIIFILIIAATAELTGHMMLFCSLLISGLIFVGFELTKNEKSQKFYKICGLVLVFLFLIGLIALESYYKKTEYERYTETFHWEKDLAKAWKWVYEQTLGNPKNIAFAGSAAAFPLYGRDFKNNVYYVSVNNKEPYLINFSRYNHLHDSFKEWLELMRQDGSLREKANFNTWLKNLYDKETDLLFIMCTDDFKNFPIEDTWAEKHKDIFRIVLTGKRVHIYEILKKDI